MKTGVAAVFLVLVSTACLAVAQAPTALDFTTTFPFYVGSKLMPAGSYKASTSANLEEIRISSTDGKQTALAPVTTRLSPRPTNTDSVVFDVVDKDHYLSEIYIAGEDGYLVRSTPGKHTHATVKGKK